MAASTSDEDSNQWPGYVDALTTMTMMLIFIMVILAVAIFGLSQNVTRDYVERIASAAEVELTGKPDDLEKLVAEVRTKVHGGQGLKELDSDVRIEKRNVAQTPITTAPEPLTGESRILRSIVPSAEPLPQRQVVVTPEQAMLRLIFQKRSVAVDLGAQAEIKSFMEKDARNRDGALFEIKAYAAAEASTSDARRIAFYRLMSVRTALLDMGISPTRIIAKVHDRLPSATTEDVHVFVRSPPA